MKILAVTAVLLTLAVSASARGWQYVSKEDEMTGEIADTISWLDADSFGNGFYGASNIYVRNRKAEGVEAEIALPQNDVICPGTCQLLVRADDKPSSKFVVTPYGSMLKVRDTVPFIEYIRKAKLVRVQIFFPEDPTKTYRGEVIFRYRSDAPLAVPPLRKAVGR